MNLAALLVALCVSIDASYSLYAPFEKTNLSEIGNWTMRGSTVNMKSFLRLTTSSVENEYGSVCHRIPTVFHDWSVELELLAKGGPTANSSLTFFFTEQVCPQQPEAFGGFRITINAIDTDSEGKSSIVFSEKKMTSVHESGRIKLRNSGTPTRVKITKKASTVTCEVFEGGEYKKVLEGSVLRAPYFGYLTFAAETGSGTGDTNDLISLRTQPLSDYETPQFDEDIDNVNRKIIETDMLRRRQQKKERRKSQLPVMDKYVNEMRRHDNKLDMKGDDDIDMNDAFGLIYEAEKRGFDAVTIDQLKLFITKNLAQAVSKASSKIDMAFERFDETKLDMHELWSYLREQMVNLALEARVQMRNLEHESVEAARKIDFGQMKLADTTPAEEAGSSVTKALVAIAVIEAIAYIVFFAVRHKKTKGFRKID